jgi:hypothetical protein
VISNEEDLLPLVKSLRDTHHIFSLRGSIAFHPGYTYLTSRRVRGAAPRGRLHEHYQVRQMCERSLTLPGHIPSDQKSSAKE